MPKTHYPRPQKRYYRRTWEIYWNWNNRRFIVYPGYAGEGDDMLAEAELRQIAAALAMPLPAFPGKYADAPAIIRYMEERYGQKTAEKITHDFDALCTEYLRQSKLVFSRGWYTTA
ncbi:MAG: hypothetical protein LBE84_03055, partial [Planctomycetota bacterium]|nr:hypothetical protein [Planctomycetota bacterium]